MDLIYSQLGALYEVFPHASDSWTEQSYALPVHFVMELQNSIHLLIGYHGQIQIRLFCFLSTHDIILFFFGLS